MKNSSTKTLWMSAVSVAIITAYYTSSPTTLLLTVIALLLAVIVFLLVAASTSLVNVPNQLSNLYTLLALHRNPLETDSLDCSVYTVNRREHLDHWYDMHVIDALAKGKSIEDATTAAHKVFYEDYIRWIAQFAPERIKNDCRGKKGFGSDITLCSSCTEAKTKAQNMWDKLMQKEKAGNKIEFHEYIIPDHDCPVSK